MQNADHVQHRTTYPVENQKRKAIERPEAQGCIWQKMCVAARAHARMLGQKGQHAQEFIGECFTKPGRDIVVPVLGRIRVPAGAGTQLQAQRHSSTLGVLQARAELGSEVVYMRVLGSFAAVEPLHDELIQALLSVVLRTNSVGGTRQQILL
nr:hypothetical protein [Cupriavidus plantarum]